MTKKTPVFLILILLFCVKTQARAAEDIIVIDGINYSKDDTGIEAAMSDLPASGGVIELTPGTYALNGTIDFAKSNITIKGRGRAILRLNDSVNAPAIHLYYFDYIALKDLEIDGNRKNQSRACDGIKTGISLDGISIENCYIHAVKGTGIFMNATRNATIRNCRIENVDANGINMHASIRYNVLDNTISGAGRYGIFLSGGSGTTVNSDFIVRGNTIAGCQGDGNSSIHVWGAQNGLISGNIIRDNANGRYGTNAVFLRSYNGSAPCNITVCENTMQNISGVFVELSSGHVVIYGNTFKGSGGDSNIHGNGIFINTGVDNVIIANNMMSGANQHGIYCQNSVSNISICGNSISNSGQSKSGAISGIRFMNSGAVRDIQIKDNRIYDDQRTCTQGYGVYASGSGSYENVKINGNIFSGHNVGDIVGLPAQQN